MHILGIETSCDETAASVIVADKEKVKILSNAISSQIPIHQKYGGVFPELASRAHLENIIPVTDAALSQASIKLDKIQMIAVTTGPGLIGSLLIGVNFAKTLAYSLNKPIIGVNHIEGHIYSAFFNVKLSFPVLSLIASGGHTSLILLPKPGKFKIIGETQDDAAGEAFDKVAQLLHLGYPGGPAIEAIAKKNLIKNSLLAYKLPRPMIYSDNFNFSFAGLKTAVLYLVKQIKGVRKTSVRQAIAKEFQQAVVDVLVAKTLTAAKKYHPKTIALGGGVSANRLLSETLAQKIQKEFPQSLFLLPPPPLCTDNAAMIALAGYYKFLVKGADKWYNVYADANQKLSHWI
jgi:N6-L-threonylcarbamoyladenine synthase